MTATVTSSARTAAERPATFEFRLHHRHSRSAPPTGRARIASPARKKRVFRQVVGTRVPLLRFLLQALEADRLQVGGHLRLQAARRHRLEVSHLLDRVQDRRADERRAAGDHLVEDDAERVHVGERADVLGVAAGLLGAM